MPRKNLALAARNRRIVQRVARGDQQQDIAKDEGISRARVCQIVSDWNADVTDDAERDLQLTKLEHYLHSTILPLVYGRGKRVVAASGVPVFEPLEVDGRPVYNERGKRLDDLDRPLYDEYAKLEALSVALRIHAQIAQLRGLNGGKRASDDKKAEEKKTETLAEFQAMLDGMKQLHEEAAAKDLVIEQLQVRLLELEAPARPYFDAEVVK
jgi:hypothetical protein